MNPDRARLDYLRWLSRYAPALYAHAMSQNQRTGLSGLGWINLVIQAVAAVGSAVMAKKQGDKAAKLQAKAIAADQAAQEAARKDALKVALLDINTKRAQAGLPPVDADGKVIPSAQLPPAPSNLAPLYAQVPGAPVPVASSSSNLPIYLILGAAALYAFAA